MQYNVNEPLKLRAKVEAKKSKENDDTAQYVVIMPDNNRILR